MYKDQTIFAYIEYNPFQRITGTIKVVPHRYYDKNSNMLKIQQWDVELRLTTTKNMGGIVKPAGVRLRFMRNQVDFMNSTLDYIYGNTNTITW